METFAQLLKFRNCVTCTALQRKLFYTGTTDVALKRVYSLHSLRCAFSSFAQIGVLERYVFSTSASFALKIFFQRAIFYLL